MSEIEFINGMIFKPPVKKDGSPLPHFIKTKGSIKISELIESLQAYQATTGKEWMNFDVKESKSSGKWYASIDSWEPSKDQQYAEGIAQAKKEMAPHPAQNQPAATGGTGGGFDDFDSDSIPF